MKTRGELLSSNSWIPCPLQCCFLTNIVIMNLRSVFVLFCSEADEIYKICSVIGSPMEIDWAEGLELASAINYQFPQVKSSFACVVAQL